jgi:tetratricopeptide (TPR) repeat protein
VLGISFALAVCLSLFAIDNSRADAASSPCSAARELQRLGRLNAAELAYLEAVKTGSGLKCATKGLEQLAAKNAAPRNGSCAKANALKAAGQKTKAEESYVRVLEAKPGAECATTGLESLAETPDFWDRVKSAGQNVGSLLALIVLGALVLVAIGLLILQPLTRIPWIRNYPPGSWFLRPSLEVNELDAGWMSEQIGVQLATLIRTRITPRTEGGISLVTGHAALTQPLKPLADVSSEAQSAVAIATLLESTLPRRNFEVSGALQPQGDAGFGISVELANQKKSLALTTLWTGEFDIPVRDQVSAFQALSLPIAGWIDHQIATAVGAQARLPSKDPLSWAMFKAGQARQERGDSMEACRLYEAALGIDAKNAGALANLGLIRQGEGKFKASGRLLTEALKRLDRRRTKIEPLLNPDWCRVKFNRAMLYAAWAQDAKTDPTERAKLQEKARTESAELARRALVTLLSRPTRDGKEARRFLERAVLPSALALYAGTAGSHAVGKGPDMVRDSRRVVLRLLRADELTATAAADYVSHQHGLSPSALYNLACAYVQLQRFGQAAQNLRKAMTTSPPVGRRQLANTALHDTSLKSLWLEKPKLEQKLKRWAA